MREVNAVTTLSLSGIRYRRAQGWSEEQIHATPKFGKSITTQCREAGVSRETYYQRRRRGLSHEAAIGATVDVNRLLRLWKPPRTEDHR